MSGTRNLSRGGRRTAAWLAGGALLLASAGALAGGRHHGHHGHSSFGFYFGGPIGPAWGPRYWGPPGYWRDPWYDYPDVVVVPAPQPPIYIQQSPPVYVQQGAPQVQAQAAPPGPANYWYWCPQANGYYPYVQQCPAGWQTVLPTPPPASTTR